VHSFILLVISAIPSGANNDTLPYHMRATLAAAPVTFFSGHAFMIEGDVMWKS
jgi:hypothetical protein